MEPTHLCDYCRAIIDWRWKSCGTPTALGYDLINPDIEDLYLEHHESWVDLEECGANCALCNLLRVGYERFVTTDSFGKQVGSINASGRFYLFLLSNTHWAFGIDQPSEYFEGFSLRRQCTVREDQRIFPGDCFAGPFFQIMAPADSFPLKTVSRPQSARPDLNLALQWVADCIDGHPGCKPAHVNFSPPTRILEIIPDEDSEKYDLKLLEKFDPAEPYVALSHCWGEYQSHPLQTTKQSLPAHLSRIPFEKLPKSFQDATTVASRLGVRRLWIDSLCIIQDDIADWEKECPLMADIYSRALVTIAASDAANSNAGFLGEYPSSLRCNIGGLIQIRCIPTFITSPVAHNEESILSGRGWALQEAIFSPRFLSFKRERLQWHCTKESRSDDILMPYWSKFDTRRAERPTIAKLLTWDERRVYESWRDIVTNFSQTKLTKPTDKLPALSGLAKAICNSLGDRYAAGVFLKDVHNMLCWTFYQPNEWRKCSENEEPSLGSEPMAYRAPSWSWASTDGELEFYSHIYFRDFEILDCQAASAGHDPFGEVTTGFIRGRGLLKRLALGNFCFRTETWGFGKIYLDHASDQAYYDTCKKQSELRPIILLLLGYDKYETRIMKGDYTYSLHDPRRRKYWRQSDAIPEDQEGGESIWQRRWVALVLGMMPEKGPDCFCRIGLATGEDCKGGEWFDGCVRETITLF